MGELSYIEQRRFEQTRVPAVRREDLSAEEQVYFDEVTAREPINGEYRAVQRRHYYRMLLQTPHFAALLAEMGRTIEMPAHRRNLALITVGADAPCHFLLMGHVADAIASGVRPEAIAAILDDDEEPLTSEERLFTRFTRQIVHLSVNDETFAAVVEILGVRGTVEFVASVNLYRMVVQFSSALGIPEPPRSEVDELLAQATQLAASGKPGFSIDHWDGR